MRPVTPNAEMTKEKGVKGGSRRISDVYVGMLRVEFSLVLGRNAARSISERVEMTKPRSCKRTCGVACGVVTRPAGAIDDAFIHCNCAESTLEL
uniref:Phage protein n=1 Tax=Ascaris lumbricoides TaxID=6252 RepID=A0A0M3HUA7_ASCLU